MAPFKGSNLRGNQHENTSSFGSFSPRLDILLTACRRAALALFAAIQFDMKEFAPCSTVLCHTAFGCHIHVFNVPDTLIKDHCYLAFKQQTNITDDIWTF